MRKRWLGRVSIVVAGVALVVLQGARGDGAALAAGVLTGYLAALSWAWVSR